MKYVLAKADDGRLALAPERVESPLMFELDTPDEQRIDLGRFLVDERHWPAILAARNVDLFADAVKRRYVELRGHEPEWDRGWVYRGFTDWLIVRDTYEEQAGALAEQIAFERGA